MSHRTREVVGEPQYLSDVVLVALPVKNRSGARYRVLSWHFWRVWESGDSVVVGMRPPQLPDRLQSEFLRLEGRLVRSFIRLVEGERLLGERARGRRGNGGRKAIRQIEMERRRVGRELHTGVGQTLAAIRLQLEVIGSELPLPPPRVMQALESISSLCMSALEQVRSVSKRLHPPEWQRLTLEDAVRQLWDLSAIRERFEGELRISPLPREPEPEIKALLYRTIQESLSNIVRHSKASRIEVELRPEGDRVLLTVSDNGIGFDLAALRAAPASVTAGIGLRSIQDLVAETRGNFGIESGPLGTKLVVSVALTLSE
jgi:signal transduction histidine kinase